jgi:hypothetical protein
VTPEQRATFDAMTAEQQVDAALIAALPPCQHERWARLARSWLRRDEQQTIARRMYATLHDDQLGGSAYHASLAVEFLALDRRGGGGDIALKAAREDALLAIKSAGEAGIDLDPILDAVAAGEADRLIPV